MEIKYLYIFCFFILQILGRTQSPLFGRRHPAGYRNGGKKTKKINTPNRGINLHWFAFSRRKKFIILRERERERGLCRLRLLLFLCPKKTPRRFVVLLFFRNFSPHRETRRALPKLSRPDRFLPHHFSCPTTSSSKECLSLFLVSNSSQSDCQHSNIFPVWRRDQVFFYKNKNNILKNSQPPMHFSFLRGFFSV